MDSTSLYRELNDLEHPNECSCLCLPEDRLVARCRRPGASPEPISFAFPAYRQISHLVAPVADRYTASRLREECYSPCSFHYISANAKWLPDNLTKASECKCAKVCDVAKSSGTFHGISLLNCNEEIGMSRSLAVAGATWCSEVLSIHFEGACHPIHKSEHRCLL